MPVQAKTANHASIRYLRSPPFEHITLFPLYVMRFLDDIGFPQERAHIASLKNYCEVLPGVPIYQVILQSANTQASLVHAACALVKLCRSADLVPRKAECPSTGRE